MCVHVRSCAWICFLETRSLHVETIVLGEEGEGDPKIALELWDLGGNVISQEQRTYGNVFF
jgi:hypothetical protein